MARLRDQLLSTYAAEGINLISGVVFGIMSARALEPEGRGVVAAAWAAVSISTLISSLGIGKSLISRLNDSDSGLTAADYLGGVLALMPVVMMLGWAVLFSMAPNFPPEQRILGWVLIALAIPVVFVSDMVRSVLRARRRIFWLNLTVSGGAVLRVAVMGLLWMLGVISIGAVLVIEIGFHAVIAAVGCWSLRGALLNGPRMGAVTGAVKAMLGYGILFQLYSLLFNMINRVNVVMLEKITGAEAAGYFAIGARLAEYMGTLTMQISFVMIPYLAQQRDKSDAVQRAMDLVRMSVLVLVPAGVVLMLVAGYLIPILYGSAFVSSVAICRTMIPGIVAAVLFQLASMPAVAAGRMRLVTMCSAIGFAVNGVAMLILTPRWGAVGAAAAATLGYVSLLGAHLLTLRLSMGISPIDVLIPKRSDFMAVRRALKV
ncbi:oligosaccharide flippase family protein [Emcibacter sp. SYSU 3D8]|uniref:lipopolysaccharide biosynthesis protein n=1 Tax=Emcibacter sp. SYSU 3D8 TaxID=3133969 RepID=UPI0031FE679F